MAVCTMLFHGSMGLKAPDDGRKLCSKHLEL